MWRLAIVLTAVGGFLTAYALTAGVVFFIPDIFLREVRLGLFAVGISMFGIGLASLLDLVETRFYATRA